MTKSKMNIDWPKLSDEDIEHKAATFRDEALTSLNISQGTSVPVEQIAELYLGYQFDFVEDNGALDSDVIGGIDFDSNTIIINAAIEGHIGRYSFTIAHEVAHHVLHREFFLEGRLEKSIMCRGGSVRPIEEVQADRFAEALIMPKDTVLRHFKSIKSRKPYTKKARLALAARIVKSSGLDNVSVSAMEMRLMHLGLIPALNEKMNPILKFLISILRR